MCKTTIERSEKKIEKDKEMEDKDGTRLERGERIGYVSTRGRSGFSGVKEACHVCDNHQVQ